MSLSYAVVTPARDEAENLPRLAASLVAQTVPPALWVVVENGSSDDTHAAARELEREHPWIRALTAPPGPPAARGAPVVRAFHAALEALDGEVDLVVKLDADVSVGPGYFARLLAAFEADPLLGMASGTCVETLDGAPARERHVTGGHVWGAARAYRWACLQDVLPLEERMGWDGIDVIKAATRGWRTETLRDLPFRHHRLEGTRDGSRVRVWRAQGDAAYFMGYRPSYVLLRTLHRASREPAALMILWAWLAAATRRRPRIADELVREHLRRQQSLRRLPARAREALGRRGR